MNALLARLQTTYPSHDFDMQPRNDVGVYDEDCVVGTPDLLITFTSPNHGECIVDPLTAGFDHCDPLAEYGISAVDATAIREHNTVALS